jgi:hypothetical protein
MTPPFKTAHHSVEATFLEIAQGLYPSFAKAKDIWSWNDGALRDIRPITPRLLS